MLVYPRTNRLLCFDGRLLHGVLPGRDNGGGRDSDPQRRRVTLMVGLWGDEDGGEEGESDSDSEEEEGEEWTPGPMVRVPYDNVRLAWPGQLGREGNWGLRANEEGAGPVFRETCAEGSGLVVLSTGAWRSIVPLPPPDAARAGGRRKRGRRKEGEEGEGEEEVEAVAFSPKTTYRFVLREAGEMGAEMGALMMTG